MGEADKKAMEEKIKDAEAAARKEERRKLKEKVKKDKISFFTDFKKFITKGNVLDMAVGVVIGAAFSNIVNGLVKMIINPCIALIPGEIFPELVYGGEYGSASADNQNPTPLVQTAKEFGVEKLLILGLANDELGYIVSPSDFLVNPDKPYIDKIVDKTGENHYEETNSVGPEMASRISETLKKLLEALY